ncbi:lipid IV(A) 3-deoxy-D-manno-octulosonic acid transferase [Halomonas sp. ML-15]|uniref:lipid IV(A) 3-deoxy-D-manno-octulosonic acid transferase n=1 Tax=Halomonas sp. ML-15 TaxID=2773305 RepID=UPI00174659FB|nr:lipid IV(A) 3-deoxy-D-manno-octulosonic acid transferase [Halomonas sp. ML-15]MBD3897064.1 lipid IV(A) 3-deoxy-D-manno-octulosonic acid transferase [Halomonas sp. ML-15]
MARGKPWARWLYCAALLLLAPLAWRRVWREQRPGRARRERLGLIAPPPSPTLWLHCASLGEVIAARPLIEALLERYPEHHLTVSTMTATGAERIEALIAARREAGQAARLHHRFLPLDFPGAARRFVARLAPALAIIFETELWPNLLAACRRRGIPLAVVNGRLSPRAFARYRHIRPLMQDALCGVDWLAAKSADDLGRFRALGMAAASSQAVGTLKYDISVAPELRAGGEALRTTLGDRPVWIAGSTHPGEEEQLLEAHARLRRSQHNALLILVPRHPQRFDAAAALCEAHGMPAARRSQGQLPAPDAAVYLGDTLGELTLLYGAADLAFVGGSLVPVGGHNLLEPAAMGTPVLSGEQLANFADVAAVLDEARALVRVADASTLATTLAALFKDDAERLRLGEAGQRVVAANRGALTRTLEVLDRLLPSK